MPSRNDNLLNNTSGMVMISPLSSQTTQDSLMDNDYEHIPV